MTRNARGFRTWSASDTPRSVGQTGRVHPWKVVYDPKTAGPTHTVPRGLGHSLLSPLVGQAFKTLRVSATLWDGYGWWPINSETTVQRFEDEHAKDAERGPYNDRMFAKAKRTKQIVRGQHAGYSDFFVPVLIRRRGGRGPCGRPHRPRAPDQRGYPRELALAHRPPGSP